MVSITNIDGIVYIINVKQSETFRDRQGFRIFPWI